jgi:TonB-linked SusC/RagA family outer membrane protein
MNVNQTLRRFKMWSFSTLILLLVSNVLNAQEMQVTGVVTDAGGNPSPGVTVVVKGTKVGAMTDFDGVYYLKASVGQVLSFSYVGMKTKELVIKSNTINVTLENDVMDIDEVTVVAYGSQKKITITGAVSSIDAKELLKSPNATIGNSLAGKVTGLTASQSSGQPGDDAPEIFIRGMGTFNDSSPIYIVDGVERSMMELDPNEIENITVLKDASATAVYGIRGANGVIIVTTKRGKEGETSISASVSMGMQQPTRLLEFTDSYTYAMRFNEAQTNDGVGAAGLRFQPNVLEAFRTNSDPLVYSNTDWMDYLLKDQASQFQGNLSVSGGTKKVRYFVSLGMLKQDGLFNTLETDYDYNFSYNRYNYRSNIDIDVTSTTKLGVTLGGRVGSRNEPNSGNRNNLFRSIYWAVPHAGPGIVDGKWIKANQAYVPGDKKEGLTPFYGKGYNNQLQSTLNMDLDLTQDLKSVTKGLTFRAKFSYNSIYTHTKTRSSSKVSYQPFFKAHLDPTDPLYQQYDITPEDNTVVLRRLGQNGELGYSEAKSKARDWYGEFGFNYKRSFGSHNLGGLLLYNQRKTYYPDEYSDIPTGVVGMVGRATYDFGNKYLAEVNIGYNGSENFAKKNRFGWFPAGSLGWVVSKESFMDEISFINYLKLRGSYGIVGNDKYGGSRFIYLEGPYSINSGGYNFGTDNPNNQITASELALGNPDISWETAHKRNIGIDTYFLDSRLAINADLFWEDRSNILMLRNTIPGFTAYSSVPVNIGEMENKGYEVEVKWRDEVGEFNYWINANVSYARNKINKIDEIPQPEEYMNVTGHPHLTSFGHIFDGFFTQEEIDSGDYADHLFSPSPGDMKYKDLNGDGIVNQNDVKALGFTRIPEYTAGLNLGFSVKNFELSMSWVGATNVTRLLGETYRVAFGDTNDRSLLKYMSDGRWTPELGDSATYPRLTLAGSQHNTKDSDFWLKDASYIRLNNAELAYNFEGKFLKGIGVKSFRLYVNGSNLLTFTKLKLTDPEANTANDSRYPLVKIYNIGLKANF